MDNFKISIINSCKAYLKDRFESISSALQEANSSLFADTKSSAGDKYETSREMIQQDITRFQSQLNLVDQDKLIIERIENNHENFIKATTGALIHTEVGYFFIAISIGKLIVDAKDIYVISSQSPIGKSLLGLSVKDTFLFQNKSIEILKID